MTPAEAQALGGRAVRAKGWRWMPGMLVLTAAGPQRLGEHARDDLWCWSGWEGEDPIGSADVPDLRDPATLGGLLALLRELFQTPDLCARRTARPTEEGAQRLAAGRPQWGVPMAEGWMLAPPRTAKERYMYERVGMHDTEAGVLVALLEIAP